MLFSSSLTTCPRNLWTWCYSSMYLCEKMKWNIPRQKTSIDRSFLYQVCDRARVSNLSRVDAATISRAFGGTGRLRPAVTHALGGTYQRIRPISGNFLKKLWKVIIYDQAIFNFETYFTVTGGNESDLWQDRMAWGLEDFTEKVQYSWTTHGFPFHRVSGICNKTSYCYR